MANILKISSAYATDKDEFTTASIKAVNDVYNIAQGSVYKLDLTTDTNTGVKITFTKNNTQTGSVVLSTITDSIAKTGTNTTPMAISAKVLDTKINDEITERLNQKINVISVASKNELKNIGNGWYSITETFGGVRATWIVTKMGTLYTATHSTEPKYVLNSVDCENWYSPYAYWHA